MIENSSAGLTMAKGELAVTVTGEERHQSVLARYAVAPGTQRRVAVELAWCTIRSGKYQGQPALEIRLDGQRVGELTYLMSKRYAPTVSQVLSQGDRPGCEAVIQRSVKGLEVVLRLPHHQTGALPLASPQLPAPTPTPRRRGTFSSHRPAWVAAAAVAVILIGAVATNTGNSTHASSPAPTTAAEPTSTQPTTTSAITTPPAPAANPEVVPPPQAPKTTTKTKTQPPPPPPATVAPQPQPTCDPNYSGCVPIASDVDCLGGGGNGPAYVKGPIRVIGTDIYDLDRDHDGIACE